MDDKLEEYHHTKYWGCFQIWPLPVTVIIVEAEAGERPLQDNLTCAVPPGARFNSIILRPKNGLKNGPKS